MATPWTANNIPNLDSKVAIVTGGNRGLGFATAEQLLRHGAEVILACRNPDRAQDALDQLRPLGKVQALTLDLADLQSVRAFAEAFCSKYARLDLLINNAGVMALPYMQTRDGFEMQIGTNHLGHFALTGLLIDQLLATPDARVVSVSSNAHRFGKMNFEDLQSTQSYSKLGAYGQSKLANLLFTLELQRRLEAQRHNVIAVAAHPGMAGTELGRVEPGRPMGALDQLFRGVGMALIPGPESGALPTLRAACDPQVAGGEYYGPRILKLAGAPVRETPSKRARDPRSAEQLWEISQTLTGVAFLEMSST